MNEKTEIKKVVGGMAIVMRELVSKIIIDKKTTEQAFNETKDYFTALTGMSAKSSANVVRMVMGLYLNDEKYVNGAIQAIANEV